MRCVSPRLVETFGVEADKLFDQSSRERAHVDLVGMVLRLACACLCRVVEANAGGGYSNLVNPPSPVPLPQKNKTRGLHPTL